MQKRDPENRSVLTLCLLFASCDVLKVIIETFESSPSLIESLLNQTYDLNPAMHMALSLSAFQKYR